MMNPDGMNDATSKVCQECEDTARQLIRCPEQLEKLLDRLPEKLRHVPASSDLRTDVPLLSAMVRSHLLREYPDLSDEALLRTVTALVYFDSPIDLIPDVIPELGFVDDGAMIAAATAQIGPEITAFRKWRDEQV